MDPNAKAPAQAAVPVATMESLAPDRLRPTPVAELARMHADTADLGPALVRIEAAFLRNFPHNIFLDLDLLAAGLASKSDSEVRDLADLIAELAAQFGGRPIQFRYVHDFLYGFDWHKWVQAAPKERQGIGPFDTTFLRWLLGRAGELRELIAKNDAKYHPIDENVHRNPFPFSRTTDDERRIFRALAARQLLPVETYDARGRSRADRPFYQLREAVAAELGILDPLPKAKLRG